MNLLEKPSVKNFLIRHRRAILWSYWTVAVTVTAVLQTLESVGVIK